MSDVMFYYDLCQFAESTTNVHQMSLNVDSTKLFKFKMWMYEWFSNDK